MKHREIRAAVLSALKENISERVSWFDGRPVLLMNRNCLLLLFT